MIEDSFSISDQPQDYSALGLEYNPFPYSPVPSEDPELFCGQEQAARAISDAVSTLLTTGKSRHLVITGKYGNGKSHTLKYTRSIVRDRTDVVVGYVSQPGEGFHDIYHEFVYDLGFDRVQTLAYEYLAAIARNHSDFSPENAEQMKQLLDDGELLLPDIVPIAIQELSDLTRFADFARAIVHLVYEDTQLYAWQWLTAEGIRYEQRKEMEIHTALDDDTMAVRAFTSIKNLLLELEYTAVFVFVDEFESVARLSAKDEQSALNSIRHLMDQNSHGLCLLFGCAPEVWQNIMSEYHAFSERIGREVTLRPLTANDINKLVESYLYRAQMENVDGIQPFTDQGIDLILQLSQGNIRQVLSLCSQSLDFATSRQETEITGETVDTMLD